MAYHGAGLHASQADGTVQQLWHACGLVVGMRAASHCIVTPCPAALAVLCIAVQRSIGLIATNSWQSGNRLLIGPAHQASCPIV